MPKNSPLEEPQFSQSLELPSAGCRNAKNCLTVHLSMDSGNSDSSQVNSSRESGSEVRKRKEKILESRGTSMSPMKSMGESLSFNSSTTTKGILPCEYYRQKLLLAGCNDVPNFSYPNYYSYIQKTAGQKVVSKLAAQQRHFEELAEAQRKRTEFVFHEELGFCEVPEKIPLRKKQSKLEPLSSNCFK